MQLVELFNFFKIVYDDIHLHDVSLTGLTV